MIATSPISAFATVRAWVGCCSSLSCRARGRRRTSRAAILARRPSANPASARAIHARIPRATAAATRNQLAVAGPERSITRGHPIRGTGRALASAAAAMAAPTFSLPVSRAARRSARARRPKRPCAFPSSSVGKAPGTTSCSFMEVIIRTTLSICALRPDVAVGATNDRNREVAAKVPVEPNQTGVGQATRCHRVRAISQWSLRSSRSSVAAR